VARHGDGAPPRSQIFSPTEAIEMSDQTVRGAPTEETLNPTETTADPVVTDIDKSKRSEEQKSMAVPSTTRITDKEKDAVTGTEKRRMLRDIEVAVAMRKHLAVTNPELNFAASLLGAVRSQPYETKE